MNNRKKYLIPVFLYLFSTASFSQKIQFTLLHTSDEHSMLLPAPLIDYHGVKSNPALGGYARLATKIREIKQQKAGEDVLLFSSGDILGGSPFAWLILNREAAEIALMNAIGYDAIAIGNHEFDYGPEVLAAYYQLAGETQNRSALVSSNIQIPENHPLGNAGIQAFKIFELAQGVKLGVFSLLGKDAVRVAPYAPPINFEDQHAVAKKMIETLKAQGADIIMAFTHSGVEEDLLLANDVDGIDIILGGHDHYTTSEPLETNNAIILHSGKYLERLGHLEFEYEIASKKLQLLNEEAGQPYHHLINSEIEEDSLIAEMVANYEMKLNEFLGVLTEDRFSDISAAIVQTEKEIQYRAMEESQLGNFVTDAMRLIGAEVTGERADLAIQANGVLRANIVPGVMDWSKSKVSFMDLATVSGLGQGPDGMPGYPLVSVYLTGQEVMNVLEVAALLPQLMGDTYFLQMSGIRVEYDPQRAYWFRIPFNGTPIPAYRAVQKAQFYSGSGFQQGNEFEDIEPERLYHIITDHYIGAFLPMIGQKLPRLNVILKNKSGEAISLDEAIIYRNEKEMKVWQSIAEYAVSLKADDGEAQIPLYYQTIGNRLVVVNAGTPLWVYLLIIVLCSTGILVLAFYYGKKLLSRKTA